VRSRAVLAAVLAFLVVGGTTLASAALAGRVTSDSARVLTNWQTQPAQTQPTPEQPTPEQPATPVPARSDAPPIVSVESEGFLAWAALDRINEVALASRNATETSSTESMIKAWIVADYLRRLDARGDQPSDAALRDARRAIRDSHNGAAERLYAAGGRDAVVDRLIDICGLAETHIPAGGSGWWSRTQMSARDAVRMGACLADGSAAGPEWTDWVLDEMRSVRGTTAAADQRPEENFEGGRWGIIDGLPEPVVEEGVAIKNGWTRIGATGNWHVNCLAITDGWILAVMMRYPADFSLDYGAERCASVASQLVLETPEPAVPPQ
jgi:hypothetical protein